jgi:transposase
VVRAVPRGLRAGNRRRARVGLVLDGSGSHRAAIPWPDHLVPLPLPPDSPELNPAEPIFRVLRPKLANRIFETSAELEDAIAAHLRPYWDQPALIQRLTGYSWWVDPHHHVTPIVKGYYSGEA